MKLATEAHHHRVAEAGKLQLERALGIRVDRAWNVAAAQRHGGAREHQAGLVDDRAGDAASLRAENQGIESGRGRNPTLRVCPMPFDDVGDSIFADAEVAGDPTIAPPAVDGMKQLRGEPV